MKYLMVLLSLLVSCSMNTPTSTPTKKSSKKIQKKREIRSCVCMEIYQPVCANDGTTYANSCEAECQGLRYKNGACY